MRTLLALLGFTAGLLARGQEAPRLSLERSSITFVSDAPLERIEAANTAAVGLLDPGQRTFAVRIPVRSFTGFNSPLQREHFLENYMEVDLHANATFQGRIIEAVDLTMPGTYSVRAKGTFTVHGVERERILPCQVVVAADGVRVTSTFDVVLADHAIRVPRVVQQKLAGTVQVKVDLLFHRGDKRP
ncbi:MAG: YceI family protein [Bacteroidetes bacterium]|nr:YceI family protein [Bacteroidota bacterium]